MNAHLADRLQGVAVGAALGDALGMPLEFGPRRALNRLVRTMQAGRLPAGTFTDDTEMALALADCLLARLPLDQETLAERFVAWYRAGPSDVGIQTRSVLSRIEGGASWQAAVRAVRQINPDSAGNGSVMRCWPVAIAFHEDLEGLMPASAAQSEVTHPHPECVAASVFANVLIYYLFQGLAPGEAVGRAIERTEMPSGLREVILAAPSKQRHELANSGWVRHTVESAVWGLLTTDSFEEALIQVVNLGADADTAGTLAGALAGAAYGLSAIPAAWRAALHGEWPLHSGARWNDAALIDLSDRLARLTLA